ncbi:MAG: Outer membrane protein assembly factor BamB [Phycisphaerae bacterium]|nr:Outer membrane protein assembly factor BamB [Phycisphaerae bacterium]
MNCERAGELIAAMALEGPGVGPRAELDEHLAACADCRALAREYGDLVLGVAAGEVPTAPRPQFAAVLGAAVAREIRGVRRGRFLRWFAVGGMAAAAVLLVLSVRLYLHDTDRPVDAPAAGPVAAESHLQIWQSGGARSAAMSPADTAIMADGRIYLMSGLGDMRVAAMNASDGRRLWLSPIRSMGYLAADRNRVYCLSEQSGSVGIVALDAATGRPLWHYRPDHAARPLQLQRPVLMGDSVCWSSERTVHMLDAAGQPRWVRPIDGEGLVSSAAGDGGRVYVATDRAAYGLSADDGRILWRESFDQPGMSFDRPELAVAGGGLCVSRRLADGGEICCLDPQSRLVLWRRSSDPAQHVLAADGRLYIRGKSVRAIRLADGQPEWEHAAEGCGPLTLGEGKLYFADSRGNGSVVAVDIADGQVRWQQEDLPSCDPFLVAGERGYLKTRDGVIHAVALAGRS